MKICLFGAASSRIDEKYVLAVERLGEEIARRGHTLVFGGGKGGLMGAAARGIHRCGGTVTGVVPEFFKGGELEALYTGCDELIYTRADDPHETAYTARVSRILSSVADGGVTVELIPEEADLPAGLSIELTDERDAE